MKIYKAEFTGRLRGSIGIFYPIATYTRGESEDGAREFLYQRFEHVTGLKLTESEVSLYVACREAGIPTENHESDLYIPATDDTRWLIKVLAQVRAETFTNQVEGGLWFDIPFAFDPFWREAERKAADRRGQGQGAQP